MLVINGAIIGGLFKFLISFVGIVKGSIEHAMIIKNNTVLIDVINFYIF